MDLIVVVHHLYTLQQYEVRGTVQFFAICFALGVHACNRSLVLLGSAKLLPGSPGQVSNAARRRTVSVDVFLFFVVMCISWCPGDDGCDGRLLALYFFVNLNQGFPCGISNNQSWSVVHIVFAWLQKLMCTSPCSFGESSRLSMWDLEQSIAVRRSPRFCSITTAGERLPQ